MITALISRLPEQIHVNGIRRFKRNKLTRRSKDQTSPGYANAHWYKSEQETAFYSKYNVKQSKNPNKSKKCFVCNKTDHIAVRRKYKSWKKEAEKEHSNQNSFLVAKTRAVRSVPRLLCIITYDTKRGLTAQRLDSSMITASNKKQSKLKTQ